MASQALGGCGVCSRGCNNHHVRQSRLHCSCKNPTHHSRTKHIDMQHHFICEKLESGEITLKYCPTEDMVADVLTKALAKNPTHHSRTKHIDVQHHHFIREKLESGEISLEYCPTEDMVADVLTKALAKDRHQRLAKAMGLREGNYSQSGSVGV